MLGASFFRGFKVAIRRPIFFLPLLCVFFLKCLNGLLLFYAVQWPFKIVFAPIIKRFWGPAAIHYPGHLFWMYRIIKKEAFFFDVILGAIATYVLILWLCNYFCKKENKISIGLLVFYVVLSAVIFLIGQKAFPLFLSHLFSVLLKVKKLPAGFVKSVFLYGNILFNSLLQTVFAYNFISLIDKGHLSGFLEGFKYLNRLFVPTFIVLFLGFLSYLPLIYWRSVLLRSTELVKLPEMVFLPLVIMDIWALLLNTIIYAILVSWYYEVKNYRTD